MSLNVGSLWASLSLNISQFTAALAQAQTQVKATGSMMNQTLGSVPGGAINNTQNQLNQLRNQMGKTGKDFQRVVGGIIMAQAFYRLTNAIGEAGKSVITFANDMQMAQISMQYFLGSKEKAAAFLDVMKDFAAVTPFTTQQAIAMTRRLMAMGFAADSVKSVMGILVDAASATGGTAEQMDRVVLALGQMKTNGYIAGQELRQLAEAGIPAYKILQEELGLTTDQLKNIGKLKISGDLGVTAILKGLQKRYKGAAKEIAETIPGMWSTIKDDFLIISEQMFKSPYNAFDNFLRGIRDKFEEMRTYLRAGGLTEMFKHMIPPEIQNSIRNIIASFKLLGKSFVDLVKALGPSIALMNGMFISALGKILPIVASIVSAISNLVVTIINVVPGIKLLIAALMGIMVVQIIGKTLMFFWSVVRLGSICAFVAKAVDILATAMQFLYVVCTRNPIVGIVMLIAGALLALALSSKTVSSWLDGLTGKLAALAGIDPGGILNTDNNKELTKWTDEFNKSLSDMNKDLTDVGKSADKSGKKVKDKFIASFDEVYQIPDKLGDTSEAIAGAYEGMKMPDLKMPDFNSIFPDNKDKNNPFKNMLPIIPENKNPKNGKRGGGGGSMTPPMNPSIVEATVTTIEIMIAKMKKILQNMWPKIPAPVIDILPFNILNDTLEKAKAATLGFIDVFSKMVIKPVVIPGVAMAVTSMNILRNVGSTTVDFLSNTLPRALTIAFTQAIPSALSSIGSFFYSVGIGILPALGQFVSGIGKGLVDGFSTMCNWVAANWKPILLGALIAVVAVVLFLFGGEIVAGIAALGAGILEALSALGGLIAGFFTGGFVASTTGAISTGFAVIIGAAGLALAGLSDVIVTNWNKITKFLDGVWSGMKLGVKLALDAISLAFTTSWNGVQTLTNTVWNGIKATVSTSIDDAKKAVNIAVGVIKSAFSTSWSILETTTSTTWSNITSTIRTMTDTISGIFSGFKSGAISTWNGIWTGIKQVLNWIIDGMNLMIGGMNKININVPEWVPGMGGNSFGINIDKIPRLANGGIIDKEQLISISEGNKREAVIPLQNSSAMAPFARAVANELAKSNPDGGSPIQLLVGTLIGDERSYMELERRLKGFRLKESIRTGG